jgi:hypothetical protein
MRKKRNLYLGRSLTCQQHDSAAAQAQISASVFDVHHCFSASKLANYLRANR